MSSDDEEQAKRRTHEGEASGEVEMEVDRGNDDYEIRRIYGRHLFGRRLVRRYGNNIATDEVYEVRVVGDRWNGRRMNELQDEMRQMWTNVIQHVRDQGVFLSDLVRIHISHRSLKNGDIKIPLQHIHELSPEGIMVRIEQVMQSYENLMMDDVLEMSVGIIRLPRGQGRHNLLSFTKDELKKKQSLALVNNSDTLCLPRSLVLCRGWNEHQAGILSRKQWRRLYDSNLSVQCDQANQLIQDIDLDDEQCSLLDNIPRYEEYMKANIVVVSATQQNSIICPEKLNDAYKKLYYLYYIESTQDSIGHFHCIKSITGLMNVTYFCHGCMHGYEHAGEHHCQATCMKCKSTNCVSAAEHKLCTDCGVEFVSQECYNRHKQHTTHGGGRQARSVCENFWQCLTCRQYFEMRSRKKEDHQCGEMYCRNCKKWDTIKDHQCYIRRPAQKKPRESLIVFDFESNQETGRHIPNLVVARRYDLNTGTYVQVHFRGDDVSTDFGRWLFHAENKNSVVTAHNMKSYDGYFLQEYLNKNSIKHSIIYSGSKIMTIRVKHHLNMDIIDTLNFFPMTLSKLPKTFGLEGVKKGDFPHDFNVSANFGYMGPYPDVQYYGIDTKKASEREELIQWYESVKNNVFDFEQELLSYCVNDVDILSRAILEFRKNMLEETGIDPLNQVTIASTTMTVFKQNFLEERFEPGTDTFMDSDLALVPATGMIFVIVLYYRW